MGKLLLVLMLTFTLIFTVGIGLGSADEMPGGVPGGVVKPVAAAARDLAGLVNDVGKAPALAKAIAKKKKGPLRSTLAFIGGAGAQLVARTVGLVENVLTPYNKTDYGVPVKGKSNLAKNTVNFIAGK